MSFERDFVRPMEAEIAEKVRGPIKIAKLTAAKRAFEIINAQWPVATGWSKMNNRININSNTFELSPEERPTVTGALVAEAENQNEAELVKLEPENVRARDRIILGNAVPYAADVGFESGKGLQIYANAFESARTEVAADLNAGRIPRRTARVRSGFGTRR